MAAEYANRKYFPHLRIVLTYIYNTTDTTCDDATGTVTTQLPGYYYATVSDACLAVIGARNDGERNSKSKNTKFRWANINAQELLNQWLTVPLQKEEKGK
ncbi:hypothetical protein RvY_00475 [Ramazzottius varieornatus]|uniref:Uncharacterized protein n=1 Tax=Ramazzottius varieornatus TaxID=947166 RepID=A0A1D1UGJ8_RAMVA|nr:hypothetical protein RvY_00475 [Ramazzottius varieornatus]